MAQMHDVSETDAVSAVSDDDARSELACVMSQFAFQQAPRLRQLLEYLVLETLDGRASRIKGFTIAQEVFGRDDPEDAHTTTIVSIQARRLRRRLGEYYAGDGKNDPVRIRIPKGTYVPVFESNSVADTADASFAAAGSRPSDPPRRMGDFRLPLAFLAVVVVAAGLIWLSQSLFFKPTTQIQESANLAIAVMPFRNLTDEPGNDQLAMGLTEDIITDLSNLSGIDVIAFSSVKLLRDKAMTPQAFGKEFAVTHSLRGSLRGKKPNFRVTAQLVNIQSGKQIWAERFDRRLDDELAFQDHLAHKIAEGLSSSFTELEDAIFEERPEADPEALVHAIRLVSWIWDK